MEKFLAQDIEKITGVKRNRLEQWIKWGFIKPSIQVARGHGSRNIWSRNDLYNIAIFKKVTESGLSRKIVADFLALSVMTGLNEEQINSITFLVYMRGAGRTAAVGVTYLKDEDPLLDLFDIQKKEALRSFEDCYVLNFPFLKEQVDKMIKKVSG